jgi:hypothetical protein
MPVVFTSVRPLLRTKDLQGTIAFYTQRLGFEVVGLAYACAFQISPLNVFRPT